MHCIGDSSTAELLVRIIISVNQLSVNGAVSVGVKNMLSRFQILIHPVQGNLLRT